MLILEVISDSDSMICALPWSPPFGLYLEPKTERNPISCGISCVDSAWAETHRARPRVGDLPSVGHPLIVGTLLVGEGSVEDHTYVSHGVDTHCWAFEDRAEKWWKQLDYKLSLVTHTRIHKYTQTQDTSSVHTVTVRLTLTRRRLRISPGFLCPVLAECKHRLSEDTERHHISVKEQVNEIQPQHKSLH